MKKAVSCIVVLVLFLCFLGPVRSRPAPSPPPKPESAAPGASATRSLGESPAAGEPEELFPPEPESRTEPEPDKRLPEDWTPVPAYEVEPFFPLDKEGLDETEREIGRFLRNIQWGTNVADINGSSKGEFFSVEELDPVLLLECCLMNEERTKEVPGSRKEDVENRARFYFGEDAVIDHAAANENEYFRSTWWFDEKAGAYSPTGWDRYGESTPFLLSYTQDGGCYEVIFTSVISNCFQGVTPPGRGEWSLTMEEAESWYRDHGARARAVLREQEDGRLIMESLEILRGYDPWEETPRTE